MKRAAVKRAGHKPVKVQARKAAPPAAPAHASRQTCLGEIELTSVSGGWWNLTQRKSGKLTDILLSSAEIFSMAAQVEAALGVPRTVCSMTLENLLNDPRR